MPFLETPPDPAPPPSSPPKVRTGRFGELEEHELIRLLDSIDDERARARFRESIYISLFVWLFIAWFLFYGPQVLFHRPRLINPADILKERELTILNATPPMPRPRPTPRAMDKKTLDALRAAERARPVLPAPTPEAPTPPPTPTPTPVPTPPVPTANLPRAPQPSVPDAPTPQPNIASAGTTTGPFARFPGPSTTTVPSRPGRTGATPGGAEILSDTRGVNWDPYLAHLLAEVKRNWIPLLPAEVDPPLLARGITGIRFKILPNGDIDGQPIIETRSGDIALDKAAWGGITTESRYAPLPKEYIDKGGTNLELRIGFYVNEQPPNSR